MTRVNENHRLNLACMHTSVSRFWVQFIGAEIEKIKFHIDIYTQSRLVVINFGHNYYSYAHIADVFQISGDENKYAEMKLVPFPSLKWIWLFFRVVGIFFYYFPSSSFVSSYFSCAWFICSQSLDQRAFRRRLISKWKSFLLDGPLFGTTKTVMKLSRAAIYNQINWGVGENSLMANSTIWNDQKERADIISLSTIVIVNGTDQTVVTNNPPCLSQHCTLLGCSVEQIQQTVKNSYVWANMCMKCVQSFL